MQISNNEISFGEGGKLKCIYYPPGTIEGDMYTELLGLLGTASRPCFGLVPELNISFNNMIKDVHNGKTCIKCSMNDAVVFIMDENGGPYVYSVSIIFLM